VSPLARPVASSRRAGLASRGGAIGRVVPANLFVAVRVEVCGCGMCGAAVIPGGAVRCGPWAGVAGFDPLAVPLAWRPACPPLLPCFCVLPAKESSWQRTGLAPARGGDR
jgi:hypothetical protein